MLNPGTTGNRPGAQAPLALPPFVTKENLFSEHYLLNVLPKKPEWSALAPVARRVRAKVLDLLRRESTYEQLTELDLDREFFDPIFRELGHVAHIQVRTAAGDFPDYVFFENTHTKTQAEAQLATDRSAFFQHAIAIGELKAWDVPLDGGKTRRAHDLDPSHPTGQLYGYLLRDRKRWGILTNGRKWRIYHYDGAWPRVGRYYEVDLAALARDPDPRVFTYFVWFFRREAFVTDAQNKTPLDRTREGSVEYSQGLADDLKEAVYKALGILSNGFLRWQPNALDGRNPEHRRQIHDSSMRLLYRLLFILKAESVGLLPLDNPAYRTQRSFDALKREIWERKRDTATPILNDADEFYTALKRLCSLIDKGSSSPGRPDQLGIPPYNGGLFRQAEPGSAQPDFLASKSIGDADLAEAIDLLTRHTGSQAIPDNEAGFVDYSSLESQQLGTLYEGLLEYHLGFAEGEDYVAVGDEELWIPESQHTGPKVTEADRRAPRGTFFLRTDKGLRHSTGSYYTPDFVVRQIIEKTVGPVLEARLNEQRERGASLRDAVLSLRVVDPAMGSGHFLVDLLDYLTPALIQAVDEDRAAGRIGADYQLTTSDARRDIAAHCIYGVDLNAMAVELAKVTLWLHTLSRGKPLTFLDHRLKTGNSLLGANVRRLSKYPDEQTRQRWASEVAQAREQRAEQRFTDAATFPPLFLDRIVGRIQQIDALRDETVDDVKRKEQLYEDLRKSAEFTKLRAFADAWMAAYFSIYASKDRTGAGSGKNYADLLWAMHQSGTQEEWQRKAKSANLEAIKELAKTKHFFHWEFEFPEVFFEGGVLKDGAGFDAVIGNPPYLNIETLYEADHEAPSVFEQLFETAGEGRYDIYVLFVERGMSLLRATGTFGYILPNKWFKGEFGRPLRGLLSRNRAVHEIVDWRNYYNIFRMKGRGPVTFVALLFLSRSPSSEFRYVAFPSLRSSDERDVAATRLIASNPAGPTRTLDLVVDYIPASRLADAPWNFTTGDAKILLDRLRKLPTLGSIAKVFTGVQTSALPVYALERAVVDRTTGRVKGWSGALQRTVEVETDATKPLIRGKDIARYRFLADDAVILFPYDLVLEHGVVVDARLIAAPEMARRFPLAWAYLNTPSIRETLEAREPDKATKRGKFVGREDWYAFAYPRGMTKFWQPKLVFPDAASEGTVAWDSPGRAMVHTVYAVEPNAGTGHSPFVLQALLNNNVFRFFMQETSNPLKDGFFRFQTRYVEPYPTPPILWNTPAAEREAACSKAQMFVAEIEAGGDPAPFLAWVDAQLQGGRSDVVHDALARMTESLNTLYAENFEESKAVMRWFERTYLRPGVAVQDLAGATKFMRFGEHPLEEVLSILRKNRPKLVVKPEDRRFQEEVEQAFRASAEKQKPRFDAARGLEPVVEEVVYRLYALTPDERQIVDEAASLVQYR